MIWRNCRYRKCQQKYQKHYSCWKMTCCWPLLSGGLYIALCGVESFQWWRKERSAEDIMRSCTFCHIEYSVEQLTIKTPPLLRMTNGTKNSPAWWVRRQGQYQKMKIMRDPSMLFIHSVASENISRIKNVFLRAWPEMGRWGEGPCPNNKITMYRMPKLKKKVVQVA